MKVKFMYQINPCVIDVLGHELIYHFVGFICSNLCSIKHQCKKENKDAPEIYHQNI